MDASIAVPRRWTRAEYEQMIDAGILQPDEHVELLDGEILPMTPQKSVHAALVYGTAKSLEQAFGDGAFARTQSPLRLSDTSMPEPDIAVIEGRWRDYEGRHPATALLIVEIAETTLRLDRQRKAPIYAAAGIPEYWIVNIVDRILEVYREPSALNGSWDYRLIRRYGADDTVAPLSRPHAAIPVADLLPSVTIEP